MRRTALNQQGRERDLTTQLKSVGGILGEFAEYVKIHPLFALITAAVVAVCYAKQAFSLNFYIDAEVIINNPGTFYNWLDIGRFGLVFLKLLLGLSWYNPYFEAGLFLVALWGMSLSAGYLFSRLDRRINSTVAGIFSLLIVVYPNYADQFLFRYQALEIVLGIWLLLLGNMWFVLWLQEKNQPAFALSLIPLVISFGVYQSMVNIQLAFYLGMFLFWLYVKGEDGRAVRRGIWGSAVHFGLAFIIHEVLVQLFFSNSDYLSSQIRWGEIGLWGGIRTVFGYGLDILFGDGVFGTVSYAVGLALLAAVVVLLLWKKRSRAVWYVCGAVGLASSPFFLCILMGSRTVVRVQLTLPFVCGMMWFFGCHVIVQLVQEAGKLQLAGYVLGLGVLLGAVLLYQQAFLLMRLFYTEDVVRRSDMITATRIIADIEDIQSVHEGKPVVFIGHRVGLRNGSSLENTGESYLLQSAFEYDYLFEPQYYFSTHRILGFFKTLGYSYNMPSREMTVQAYEYSEGMVCWPLPGAVQEFDDFILVKLSN